MIRSTKSTKGEAVNMNADNSAMDENGRVEQSIWLSDVVVKQEVNVSGPTEQPMPFLTVLVKEEPVDNFENEIESKIERKRRLARQRMAKYRSQYRQMHTEEELKEKRKAEALARRLRRQKGTSNKPKERIQKSTALKKQRLLNVKDEATDNFEVNESEPLEQLTFNPNVIVKEELIIDDDESDRTENEKFDNFAVDNEDSMSSIDSVERDNCKNEKVHFKTESKIERRRRLRREATARHRAKRRQILTGNELKKERMTKALAKRLLRQSETPEQTETRRRKEREQRKLSRLNESAEQTEARRVEQRERRKMSRVTETPEQTEARRRAERERRKMSRLMETPEQTEARLLAERERRKISRLIETPQQTEARRLKERNQRHMTRLKEIPEQIEE